MKKKAIIVGGGINGLSLAEALLERGFFVTVYDSEDIPNRNSASFLEQQIIRPQYVDQTGLGMRIQPALTAWRALFKKLGENFFRPEGVVAISREEGDWAERAMQLMRKQNLPFRYVHASVLQDMMPALNFDARFGVLADWGGVLRGAELMLRLKSYLQSHGVEFKPHTQIEEIDNDHGFVRTKDHKDTADWIIVTGGQKQLVPEIGGQMQDFMGCYAEYEIPLEDLSRWRFSPIWVDLGANANCWGIPQNVDRTLRLGAGNLSVLVDDHDIDIQTKLERVYEKLINNFGRYQMINFRRVHYQGFASGDLVLKRFGQTLVLAADSGHGFKFAAENAQAIANALESDTLSFAARHIAGV